MAGIFERISTITKASVNDLLDRFEDPAKLVDQTILDAKEELAKIKKESLTVLANEKSTKTQMEEALKQADQWHGIAANALKAGNEEDAKKALAKEQELRADAETKKAVYQTAKASADKLRTKIKDTEDEIQDMQAKAAQIKAKAATAKAIQTAEKVSSKGINRGAFDAFDRMEEKADRQLAEAEALEDLNRSTGTEEEEDLMKKYSGSSDSGVDASFEALKAELGL